MTYPTHNVLPVPVKILYEGREKMIMPQRLIFTHHPGAAEPEMVLEAIELIAGNPKVRRSCRLALARVEWT